MQPNPSEARTDPDASIVSLGIADLAGQANESGLVLHWYDFTCPFCYVGQSRTAILFKRGLRIAGLPFQAHPEIPPSGILMADRNGTMYGMLEREARDVGLPLRWSHRLPNSRRALAAAEWIRRHQSGAFASFSAALFSAHFALGQDLGDPAVIDLYARAQAINIAAFEAAFLDGSAMAAVAEAEDFDRRYGVHGTPAWRIAGRLISGLHPASDFEELSKIANEQ